MQCIELTGSDNRLDCRDMFHDPLNLLPVKCAGCGFPDLECVPHPYYLIKSRTLSPNEMASAENGNFLVRDRVRHVLQVLAPRQCQFFATHYQGTSEETPWSLAVPTHQIATALVKPSIPRCQVCSEPRSAHPGSQYDDWLWNYQSDYDLLNSSTWGSSEQGWNKWIHRDFFMSVRLFHLLKSIGAKGLYETTCGETTKPDKKDAEWIRDSIVTLHRSSVALNSPGTVSGEDAKWLRKYASTHSRDLALTYDVKALEKHLNLKLPKSYVEFITKVGPLAFQDVDEYEGFTVHVLAPDEIDTKNYRAGVLDADDEQTKSVDGIMFASTKHGDCFCFDIQKDRKEYQVFLYQHEYAGFEPYAENFAACIKRFAASCG